MDMLFPCKLVTAFSLFVSFREEKNIIFDHDSTISLMKSTAVTCVA